MSRKTFQRLSLDVRRRSLMEATLTCVARHGLHGASVRRITEEAGVTVGLVRHYFGSKDDMIRNAYAYLVGQLTAQASESARAAEGTPEAQLASFLRANLTRPNMDEETVSLWATFIGRVRHDPGFAEIHRDGYREFLSVLETLIEPVLIHHGCPYSVAICRNHAIALNGLIDGLWMEGAINSGLYAQDILPDLITGAAERLLELPAGALSAPDIALQSTGHPINREQQSKPS
ncbi:transcriptional regulator [Thalassospira sp. HJ]|uniref:TetR family transcriptional regulator C-terminal domain-containing protein n=1 Tax=Thalassospira sp. HJ TaxID=1616823 RepID=UPI0005CE351E|nr:TetR family transcriptional regulator C-terminal domain-containing protein [Thalassospira sp. HJ]KJE33722.1 transcriptional regulator [Thalassospira sp. HJ]